MQAVDTLNSCIYANIFLSPWLVTETRIPVRQSFTLMTSLSQYSSLIQSDSFSIVRNLLCLKVFKIFQFPLKFRTFYRMLLSESSLMNPAWNLESFPSVFNSGTFFSIIYLIIVSLFIVLFFFFLILLELLCFSC